MFRCFEIFYTGSFGNLFANLLNANSFRQVFSTFGVKFRANWIMNMITEILDENINAKIDSKL